MKKYNGLASMISRLTTTGICLLLCAVQLAQGSASLSGQVSDPAETPLIGASVYLEGTSTGAITDINGRYTITGIEPGNYNIIASYVGYESQTQFNVPVRSVGNAPINFELKENSQTLGEVVVQPEKNVISRPKDSPLSAQTLTAVELATYPGGNNDVVRVAQSLPGISPSVGGFRNDLIIRGGAPNETVYYLDGVEIPNINHFATQGSSGGPVGLLNVSFIEDVTLSTSAFGAQYDNPLSGVLQFKQRKGDAQDLSANFRLSASEAAVTVNGPLFRGENQYSKTTFIASVRRSYLQFLFEFIGLPIRPDYYDYQYKIDHEINAYNTISLIGVGSIDRFTVAVPEELEDAGRATLEQAPFIDQQSNTIGVSWRRRFKNRIGYDLTTLSNNFLDNRFSRYSDPENEAGLVFRSDSREMESKLRYESNHFWDDWRLRTGFNIQRSDYQNTTANTQSGFGYTTSFDMLKYGAFITVTRTLFKGKMDLTAGLRTDADSYTTSSDALDNLSPRLALSYGLSDVWKLNATVGRYFKLPPYTILGYQEGGELVNKNVKYTRSDHLVVGVERILNPASSVSMEGFLKLYDDYPVSVRDSVSLANKGAGFEVLGNERIASVGAGRSYGMELLFQQKLRNNFYGILSYTFYRSEFTGFNRDEFIPSVWDSRHLVSFTGGYQLKRNWELSARWRFAAETPDVPVDIEQTLLTYPELIIDYSRLGESNLGAFSAVDIRIDKRWDNPKLSFNIFLEIQNVLGQDVPQPAEYILARDDMGMELNPRSLLPITQDSSTPIPTIGIVVDL